MKQIYLTFFLAFFYNFTFANEYELALALEPTATILGNATVCQNAASPIITFTGSGGTAPYTFTYKINGGADLNVVTTSGNSVTVSASTGTAGTFTYSLVSVSDSQPPNNPVNVTGSVVITVNPQPNANMGGTGSGSTFEGSQVFRVCSNVASLLSFTNTSTSASTNSNYTINWGDGSPNFTGSTWTTLSHTYQVGLWYLTYTITGNNGCIITRTYIVFVGSNPAVSLGNPGNTDICNANSLTFPITGTANNPAGTTYTVTFNDGSAPQIFNHPPPSSVTHTFTTSSCGTNSSDGSNSYPNSFSANIVATNPCSTSSVGVVPIYVSANPQANFTSVTSACTNSQVCFTNTSLGNQVISNNCSNPSIIWSISPSTGFTIATGSSLGNDFSSTDPSLWLSGSENLCVSFSVGGTYTITIKTGNKCGIDTEIKTICIQPPISPLFTLNSDSGCTPLAITATNNTVLTNQCATPTYLWSVTYAAANCGTTITPIPNQTTPNASYNFTVPGIYTITLTTTNSCGSTTLSKTVTVKKPPTVSIASISDSCGVANINPVATINSCAPASSSLTYAWSFPGGIPATANTANPGTVNYPNPGTYTVSLIVSNECGPSTTATQGFTVNVAPVITNTELSQTICSGNQTSLVNLIANPTGTTFTWTATATPGINGFTPSGSNTIPVQTISTTNTNPGTVTYTIVPTFNGCIGASVNYIINVNPAPTITTQPNSSTVCLNGVPTPLVVSLSSVAGSPTYQWFSNTVNSTTGGTLINGATSATFNPPANTVGTLYYYCVITLSSGGCSSLTSNIATVTVNPLPSITTQPLATQNGCVGVTITALTASFTGGTGTATYQWFSNTVNSNSGGTLIPGATNPSYTPPTFTNPDNYYYYVVINLNGNGCGTTTSAVAEVVIFNDPIITSQPIPTQTLCQSAVPQTLEITATGGNGSFSYQWYSNPNNNTTSGTPISGATNPSHIPQTSTVGTLYYYCIITQTTPGCSVTSATAAVIVNTSPTIVNQPVSSTVCLGGTPITLQFTFANGAGTATYQWYSNTTNDTVSGTAIFGATNPTFIPPSDTIGTLFYYCLVTFSGITGNCATISTNTTAITVIPGATIDQQPIVSQSLCVGGTISIPLSVNFSGGTGTPSYQWYSNTTNSNSGGTLIPGAINATYTPPVFTTAGSYYYYAIINFSGSGCGAITSDVAEIIIVIDPIINTQPIPTQTLCQNATPNDLTVEASGGVGSSSYNYQWYVSSTNSTTAGTPIIGATNQSFTPPTNTAGTLYYYCIVTQPNDTGCNVTSSSATINVNLAPSITVQPISNTICLGQSTPTLSFTFINGLGTPTFQWYSNTSDSNTGGLLITGATNSTYTPAVSMVGTTYYYCVINFTDLTGGCEIITTEAVAITINQIPVITNESTTICSGTTFTVNPTNSGGNSIPIGTTYIWSEPVINPLGSITGASQQNAPQTEISQTLINTTSSVATVTYSIIPTSGICQGDTFTVTVTVNPSINPNSIVNNSTCFGINNAVISTNITGGVPFSSGNPYLINWIGPNGFTSTETTITNLEPGTYTLTVDDAGGCPFTDSYIITEPADIQITVDSENDITCFNSTNGSINITTIGGTGDYFYTWTYNGNPFGTSEDVSNLSPGTYIVSVTDINNCGPKTATFEITEPPLLEVTLINQINIECFGDTTGAIEVVTTGGTIAGAYSFSWLGPNGFSSTSQNLENLIAGAYVLTVTDDNGCEALLSVTLTQSPEIIISYTTTPISCYGANDATLSVVLSGGVPPFQFTWNNLSTSLNQNNLSAGDYIITVTDAYGCVRVETITIPEAPVFVVNPIVTQITCFGANNGSINLNLTGGIPPVTLQWSDGSTAGLIRNNLPPGTYTATISDGTPCFIVRTFTIIEPQLLVLSASLTQPTDCLNAASGTINLIVSGGTPPFTYQWSNGATTENLSGVVAGNYGVTVTDANGCTKSGQFTLIRPNPLTVAVNTQTDANCETREVIQYFIAQASGGLPPYNYQWSSGNVSGANNQIMQTNSNGMVILTVTDALGCSIEFNVNVENPVIGNPDIESESFGYLTYGIYAINDPIQFYGNVTGDYLNVIWDFGDGTFSNELNPIHTYTIEREYIVKMTVTYPFGCIYVLTISLLVEKGYLLVIPSAFTPNNDGLNDTFRPVSKYLKNLRMDVYDSWGSMIFSESGEVLVGWDGMIKGINAENGNYYSVITAETFYGAIIQQNQTFVLIK